MGFNLRRWFADYLPSDLSPGERLVALEIADLAKDETRLAFGRDLLETVARRTGYADPKQVGKVLGKLAARGLELRVQVIKDGRPLFDKRNRPIFAYEGRQTTYRIPTLRLEVPPDLLTYRYRANRYRMEEKQVAPSGRVVPSTGEEPAVDLPVVPQRGDHSGPVVSPLEASGPPTGAQWSPRDVPVVPPQGDPSPHVSSESPHLFPAAGACPVAGEDLDQEITMLLTGQTGRPVDAKWAAKVRSEILDRRDGVRDPRAYVLAAIRKEPGRYAPLSGPWEDPVPDAGQAQTALAKSAAARAREQYPNLRHRRQQPPEASLENGG